MCTWNVSSWVDFWSIWHKKLKICSFDVCRSLSNFLFSNKLHDVAELSINKHQGVFLQDFKVIVAASRCGKIILILYNCCLGYSDPLMHVSKIKDRAHSLSTTSRAMWHYLDCFGIISSALINNMCMTAISLDYMLIRSWRGAHNIFLAVVTPVLHSQGLPIISQNVFWLKCYYSRYRPKFKIL